MKVLLKNNVIKNFSVFLLLVFMASCVEEEPASTSSNKTTQQVSKSKMDKLVIDAKNELKSIEEMAVEVYMTTPRAFLSICEVTDQQVDVSTLDYQKCIVRSSLTAGGNNFQLTLPNHTKTMVAIIWFYETDRAPLINYWERADRNNKVVLHDNAWVIQEEAE